MHSLKSSAYLTRTPSCIVITTGSIQGYQHLSYIPYILPGRAVLVVGFNSDVMSVFDRNTTTGDLTAHGGHSLTGAGCNGFLAPGLDGPSSITVTADSKAIFVTGFHGDALVTFTRNTTNGAVLYSRCDSEGGVGGCAVARGLDSASDVTVTADGKSVYTASVFGGSSTFSRNPFTGALTYASCIAEAGTPGCLAGSPLFGPLDVEVTADGKSVYVGAFNSDAVVGFARNTATGTLTQQSCVSEDGSGGCADGGALDGAGGLVISPNGRSLYVMSFHSDAIAAFSRNAGGFGF